MITLADKIETELRAHIVGGIYPPAGRLRLEELTRRYGAGASPVREALSRLYAEGIVELESNKGFRVPDLTRADLVDIAFARATIEAAALRKAIESQNDQWEADLVAALHRYRQVNRRADFTDERSVAEWEAAHDGLHHALIVGCNSPRILAMQQRLLIQHARYRRYLYSVPLDFGVHEQEHVELVEAVLDRDVALASALMAKHIMITVDVLDEWKVWDGDGKTTR